MQKILACSDCDAYLRKFAKGRFTIRQLCMHFSKKYSNIYEHVMVLKNAGLIDLADKSDSTAKKPYRILFTITSKGKMALMEKGDLNG